MKLKTLSLLIVVLSLTACATPVSKTQLEIYCPSIQAYTSEFSNSLADELVELPENSTAIEQVVADYITLRDKIKACITKRDAL